MDELRNAPADGRRGQNSVSIQNQARGGYQTSIPDEAVRSAFRVGLCITGVRHMVGTALPNHHERILARHLNGAQDMET